MTASELYQAGKLDEAIAAATQEVKDQPADRSRRTLLFALLCFAGEYERAKKQLTAIDSQTTLTDAPAYLNLLAAEDKRRRVLTEGLRPHFFVDPPARLDLHLQAICRLKEGNSAQAQALLESAEEGRPEVAGSFNGTPFDDFADADDITRPFLEVFVGDEYSWAPFEQLQSLQVALPDPIRPRDTLWAPCQLMFKDAVMQRGFTPVRYFNSHQAHDDVLRLGHGTEFDDAGSGVYRGLGRKQFVAGEMDATPLELRDAVFNSSNG